MSRFVPAKLHGMLDFIVDRSEMKATLARCLRLLWTPGRQAEGGRG